MKRKLKKLDAEQNLGGKKLRNQKKYSRGNWRKYTGNMDQFKRTS